MNKLYAMLMLIVTTAGCSLSAMDDNKLQLKDVSSDIQKGSCSSEKLTKFISDNLELGNSRLTFEDKKELEKNLVATEFTIKCLMEGKAKFLGDKGIDRLAQMEVMQPLTKLLVENLKMQETLKDSK